MSILQQLIEEISPKSELGFVPKPSSPIRYVYIRRAGKSPICWYQLIEEQEVLIQEECVKGYLKDIELKIVDITYKGKTTPKLKIQIHLDTGKETVIIRSGPTTFSRGLILSLIEVEDLSQPVYIAPVPASEDNIVYSEVYNHKGQKIIPDWNKYQIKKWDEEEKPSIDEVFTEYKEKINMIRKKLNLPELTEIKTGDEIKTETIQEIKKVGESKAKEIMKRKFPQASNWDTLTKAEKIEYLEALKILSRKELTSYR